MKKITFQLVLWAILLALCWLAEAQQPKVIYRIGYLGAGSVATAGHHAKAFAEGLRELGYIDGQNIAIEYRWAEGQVEKLAGFVDDFIRLKVDLIISSATPAIRLAKEKTSSIPIIMAGVTDPVGVGFVASLAKPGGNITGLTHLAPDLTGKRLEILKEVVPRASRIAVVWNPQQPGQAVAFKESQVAAVPLKLTVISIEAKNREEIETALGGALKQRAQALFELPDPVIFANREAITKFAATHQIPAMYSFGEYAEAGGLISYGTSFSGLFYRAATFVDKVLKGAKPADLPVEQPTKFELVVNLKTAKMIGVVIPQRVLARRIESFGSSYRETVGTDEGDDSETCANSRHWKFERAGQHTGPEGKGTCCTGARNQNCVS